MEKICGARQATDDNIIRRMCRHLHTHSEYVELIAFPLQQWLHEHASMLRYTYIACPVFFYYVKNKRKRN